MVRGYLNSLIGARSGFLNFSESVNYYSWFPFQNLQRTGSFHQRTGKGPTPGYFKIFKELPVFIRELEKERWL